MGILFSSSRADPRVMHRLRSIERKLDAIMAQLGIKLPTDDFQEVRSLAINGHKIQAIKLYRHQTGSGLAEAKSFIDTL